MKIAPDGSHRKNSGARQEMEKRLLFDWVVRIKRTRKTVNDRAQDAVDVNSHPALTALAGLNNAHLWT